jgi:hypothetical protein
MILGGFKIMQIAHLKKYLLSKYSIFKKLNQEENTITSKIKINLNKRTVNNTVI